MLITRENKFTVRLKLVRYDSVQVILPSYHQISTDLQVNWKLKDGIPE